MFTVISLAPLPPGLAVNKCIIIAGFFSGAEHDSLLYVALDRGDGSVAQKTFNIFEFFPEYFPSSLLSQ